MISAEHFDRTVFVGFFFSLEAKETKLTTFISFQFLRLGRDQNWCCGIINDWPWRACIERKKKDRRAYCTSISYILPFFKITASNPCSVLSLRWQHDLYSSFDAVNKFCMETYQLFQSCRATRFLLARSRLQVSLFFSPLSPHNDIVWSLSFLFPHPCCSLLQHTFALL